jgi:hypothetical protein
MRKQKKSTSVLVVITTFMATVLFLLISSYGNEAGGNRFVDLGDGTVRDKSSGLIWLKNANCYGPNSWKNAMDKVAALHTGECGLTDGSSKGDWRLPTKEEWEASVVRSHGSQSDAFSNVQYGGYWSSTPDVGDTDLAWRM